MFATSMDAYYNTEMTRRLLPCVCLDRDQMSVVGKTLALLWQLWLVGGPALATFLFLLSRIRSITTDMGTESKVIDMRGNKVATFLHGLGFKCRRTAFPTWMLPRAMPIHGWKHLWDNILCRGLSSLPWFPSWLKRLKALISFVGNKTLMRSWCKELKQRWPDVADIIEKISVPIFPTWRWCVLQLCCKALAPVLSVLSRYFDPAFFGNENRTRINLVREALHSSQWTHCFNFCLWYTEWLGSIMQWGGGCECHDEELKAGKNVCCWRKGRRLQHAWRYAAAALDAGLNEANSWVGNPFGGTIPQLHDLLGCIRGSFTLAHYKLRYLSKIPWLIARILEPGVRDECLIQWNSVPVAEHQRVSVEFFGAGQLRRDIDMLAPDGSGATELLKQEVESGFGGRRPPRYSETFEAQSSQCGLAMGCEQCSPGPEH